MINKKLSTKDKIQKHFDRRLSRFGKWIKPPGLFVVIAGPDGVGKSTTSALTKEILERKDIKVKHFHLGFRPAVLPSRTKFGLGSPKPGNRFLDLIRFAYHAFDHFLGYWLRIRPITVNFGIVLAERYFYDYLVCLERKRVKVNKKVIYLVFKLLLPKPDVFVLLSNNPDEIYRRRQELNKSQIREQLSSLERMGKKIKRFIRISTDKTADKVAEELADYLVTTLEEKIKN